MHNHPSFPFSWLQKLRKALFGLEPQNTAELTTLLRSMQHHGHMDSDSLRMMEGVLQVAEMRVSEIIIPRTEMVVVQKDAMLQTILPIVIQSGHSRFPVIGENKDDVLGILLAKDILSYFLESERFSIRDILRPAIFIPESKPLNILLREFRNSRQHIAIVVDEYGGVSGLVTIEDVLEQIVGEIEDEHDTDGKDIYIRKHKENTYSVKALTPIPEFNAFFHTQFKDDEFDTIGGLVSKNFGHLPKRGEMISIENFHFKVLRANNRRIQVLQVSPIQAEPD